MQGDHGRSYSREHVQNVRRVIKKKNKNGPQENDIKTNTKDLLMQQDKKQCIHM